MPIDDKPKCRKNIVKSSIQHTLYQDGKAVRHYLGDSFHSFESGRDEGSQVHQDAQTGSICVMCEELLRRCDNVNSLEDFCVDLLDE
mmetsp:Transcript_26671/g.45524  ORF Transcript_26671/g.45524 Transcript_26671/m.45524 type:complete len:87 (-) Transcript_26671:185-445(-)